MYCNRQQVFAYAYNEAQMGITGSTWHFQYFRPKAYSLSLMDHIGSLRLTVKK